VVVIHIIHNVVVVFAILLFFQYISQQLTTPTTNQIILRLQRCHPYGFKSSIQNISRLIVM